ncbi:MAG TPA: xanthine dehydrogenase family protein molybdopterin-binding subunit, partial [Kofleriaceae bacterium]|nr:xanthine dehydrogenase family protein molybdopterin-binding subunit [Kofleriaceae bacterium]
MEANQSPDQARPTSIGSAGSVGSSIPRVDGEAKVRGSALYVDDLAAPDVLHGATVRSQVAHGVLRAIRLDPAFDWTGVVVVTAADIPGRNTIYLIEVDQPALVPIDGTIRHVDEPVALVAAPTRRRAQQAAAHVLLDVDPLPAVHTIEDSLRADVVLFGDDNVFKRFAIRKGGDVEAALAAADLVVEGEYTTGAQEQMYIEPQGMIARFTDGGTCEVIGSLQCPYYVHKALKPLLDLPDDKVVIAQSVTGGGFGGKEEYPSMIAAHAALLARKARRPVKIIYDRDEDIGATTKRHPARVRHRLGLRRDGTLVAIDVDVVFDGGAYVTLSPVVLSRGVLHAAGPYNCPTVRVTGRAVATNTAPHGAFRGFGAPQTTFAYERQMEKAARLLGIESFEMRRRNMLRLGDDTATSQVLTYSVGSDKVLDAVASAVSGPRAARDSGGAGSPAVRRGRGLAFYFHGAGFTGSGEQRLAGRATVALTAAGRFEVRTSSTDIGQGALTMFSQIAAAALRVEVDRVDIAAQNTSQVPDSGPTVASRTCMVVGAVVGRAALALRQRVEAWAAERGVGGGVAGAAAAMAGERAARGEAELGETAQYEPPPGIEWDDATYTGSAYPVYGWACCLVDVAVDLDSYEVTVERCVHAIDVGRAIHPILVKGQIEGGTLQALGWALWENVVYREGRVVNRRMTDCIVPTFADAPEMETLLVEEPYPFGPHGAKGVGEIPMDGPAAAVANAIEDALGGAAA